MADCGTTNMGGVFSISDTIENEDLTAGEFGGLSWVDVPNMLPHGDTGNSQNIVSQSTWDNPVLCKGKGETDAGSPDVEFLDVPSAGIDAMNDAATFDNHNNYAFRIVWGDGVIEYNRGLVTGPTRLKGGNEDFRRLSYSLGMVQEAVVDESSTT